MYQRIKRIHTHAQSRHLSSQRTHNTAASSQYVYALLQQQPRELANPNFHPGIFIQGFAQMGRVTFTGQSALKYQQSYLPTQQHLGLRLHQQLLLLLGLRLHEQQQQLMQPRPPQTQHQQQPGSSPGAAAAEAAVDAAPDPEAAAVGAAADPRPQTQQQQQQQ